MGLSVSFGKFDLIHRSLFVTVTFHVYICQNLGPLTGKHNKVLHATLTYGREQRKSPGYFVNPGARVNTQSLYRLNIKLQRLHLPDILKL